MKVLYSYLADQFKEPEPILEAIRSKLLKHMQFTFGDELLEFEQRIKEYTGAKYCLGTSSGTMALTMLLQAAGVGFEDEVVTVSQTFVATIGSIVALGARPYFVDVCDDYTMEPEKIEMAIGEKTKAILPVHYSGNPARMEKIMEIAEKYGLPVIEDACCAISGKINGKHVGTFGTGGAFSVHPLKNLNVWGDGGLVVTNSEEIFQKIILLRNHGLKGGIKGRDEIEVFGHNARLDTLQAIVGNYLYNQIDKITDSRISNAEKYDEALSSDVLKDFIHLPERRKGVRHVYHMYMFLAEHRDQLLSYLIDSGIEAKIHYPIPMHQQKAVLDQKKTFGKTDLSNTEYQCKKLISLPVHQHLREEQIDFVIKRINTFYAEGLWK